MLILQFDTEDQAAAIAALLLYATYRSRDRGRLKVTPDLWAQVERFTKASAKRAQSLPVFIETLKPRLGCGTLHPRWLADDSMPARVSRVALHDRDTGALDAVMELSGAGGGRAFGTGLLSRAPERQVLDRLYRQTAWVVLLVRDRLERERPYEAQLDRDDVDALVITEESAR